MNTDVIAIIAFHNEWRHAEMCFRHLERNHTPCWLVDNSVEGADELYRRYGKQIVGWTRQPWSGVFDLQSQIRCKQAATDQLGDVWIVHQDIDEVFYSDHIGEPLAEACRRVQRLQYNVIEFKDFTFIPSRFDGLFGRAVDAQRHYYCLIQKSVRQRRAFLPASGLRFNRDGHQPIGSAVAYPAEMQMRHYMFADRKHMRDKYARRVFADADVKIGMHRTRLPMATLKLPQPDFRRFKRVQTDQWLLDDSDVKKLHYWEWIGFRG
ncbi:hypothetical protein OAS86_06210 [Gammaproteobacteria bacterium]|nr:hypothetical protein [Gammaproteobacteria bacterium]